MKLSRFTPAEVFDIRKPLWDGRKVGLNVKRIRQHNEVNILYEDTDGKRIYPVSLYVSGEKAKTYPIRPVPNFPDVHLHMIPIADLEVLERV